RIPAYTAAAVTQAKQTGARIIAIGTTVVRALEHAAAADGLVRAGTGVATQRIGPASRLRVGDALFSGTHESGTSHYELLRAFASSRTLTQMEQQLDAQGYKTHEFGDSILVEKCQLSRRSLAPLVFTRRPTGRQPRAKQNQYESQSSADTQSLM